MLRHTLKRGVAQHAAALTPPASEPRSISKVNAKQNIGIMMPQHAYFTGIYFFSS